MQEMNEALRTSTLDFEKTPAEKAPGALVTEKSEKALATEQAAAAFVTEKAEKSSLFAILMETIERATIEKNESKESEKNLFMAESLGVPEIKSNLTIEQELREEMLRNLTN